MYSISDFFKDDTVTTMENSPSLAAAPTGSWSFTRTTENQMFFFL